MLDIEYLTDKKGQQKAVILPIELWRHIFPQQDGSIEELSIAVEDYCLNKAMDEAMGSPLMNAAEAMAYLQDKQQ
jgi:hypothetical protein